MLARIALVEDNDELRDEILVPGLTEYGFRVSGFATATAFRSSTDHLSFDIVVIDISLPDESGLKIIQRLRAEGFVAGLVVLSALPIERAGVSTFQLGGDLYLTKPIKVDLLVSALHAVLRRTWGKSPAVKSNAVETIVHQPDWYVTASSGELIPLTAIERTLIHRLRGSRGEAVSKDELIEVIAEGAADFDPNRLDVLLHRLRKKLSASNAAKMEIVTVRGAGYVLVETPDG